MDGVGHVMNSWGYCAGLISRNWLLHRAPLFWGRWEMPHKREGALFGESFTSFVYMFIKLHERHIPMYPNPDI